HHLAGDGVGPLGERARILQEPRPLRAHPPKLLERPHRVGRRGAALGGRVGRRTRAHLVDARRTLVKLGPVLRGLGLAALGILQLGGELDAFGAAGEVDARGFLVLDGEQPRSVGGRAGRGAHPRLDLRRVDVGRKPRDAHRPE
ncbi:MAG: hypothetical protein ACK559_02870, partial [bacterium]